MSVPKKKKPIAKTKMGRSHQALKKVKLTKCSKCKKPVLPHRVCSSCGYYKGREVIKIKTKLKKKKENEKQEKKDKRAEDKK